MTTHTRATLACLTGYGIFGFSFLFSKVALDLVPPFVLLSIRFLMAFLVLNLILLATRRRLALRGKPVGRLLLMGLLQPVLYFILESYGISLTSTSFSGIIIGMSPVVGLVLGTLMLKERCTPLQVVCTLCSVAGVILTTTGGLGVFSPGGLAVLLGALFSTSLFSVLSRSLSVHFSAFERTYVMFAMGSVIFTAVALVQGRGQAALLLPALSQPRLWAALLYLSVASSVGAFLLINFGLNHITASRSLIFSNFTTVISVLSGIFIMHDAFSPLQLLGVAVIILSVFGISCLAPAPADQPAPQELTQPPQ